MKSITVSAPGKLMLMGEHAVVFGRPCIVTAVEQRMKATVSFTNSDTLEIFAPHIGLVDYSKKVDMLGQAEIVKGAQFIEYAVKNLIVKHPIDSGIRVETSSEFSSQLGFGSSSASTVCVIFALSELVGFKLSLKEIFDIAYKTVVDVQGKGSGFDVASAIYGGTIYFVTGGEVIEPLHVDNFPLVVGYSGIKADTVTLLDQVAQLTKEKSKFVNDTYDEIATLVKIGRKELEKRNWKELGELMNKNQTLLSGLGISTPKLDEMIDAVRSVGAYGAKLSGAGGGDCIIALCSSDITHSIEDVIKNVGGQVIPINTNAEGIRIE